MRVFDLALKDLVQLVRDWKAALFLVVMPVLFTVMMGLAFGGFGGEAEDPRLPVGVVDNDGSPGSGYLVEFLAGSEAVRPVALQGRDAAPDRVDRQVSDEELAAAVVIPAGYGRALLAGSGAPLEVIADSNGAAGRAAADEIQAIVARLSGAAMAAGLIVEAYERDRAFDDDAARAEFEAGAFGRAVAAWADPALTVVSTESGAVPEDDEPAAARGGFAHTSPAMMVQFAIAGLIGAAEILVLERKSRALRRLLTTPISRAQIVLGHFLAMVVMILVQSIILIAFGQLVLHVDYMREPAAIVLAALAMTLWTASLGLVIGVLAKTEDQVVIFSLIPMFILAGVGGAWMPLEFTGKTFQAIGHVLPTAWAMDAFENIVIRGMGLESVLLPVAVMLAYAVVLFAIGAWRFRFE